MMIEYIVKYQNSYVYAHLFEFNLVLLVKAAVPMVDLFESAVLGYEFDFDEWPATHPNKATMQRPYNHSVFALRQQYPEVFKELW